MRVVLSEGGGRLTNTIPATPKVNTITMTATVVLGSVLIGYSVVGYTTFISKLYNIVIESIPYNFISKLYNIVIESIPDK
jgi:hypothetical protein